MRFEQVQRFLLLKKIFWVYGHFKYSEIALNKICQKLNGRHFQFQTRFQFSLFVTFYPLVELTFGVNSFQVSFPSMKLVVS